MPAVRQDPTSRHRKRALAPWRNQRVRCVAVGVCCTCVLATAVMASLLRCMEVANEPMPARAAGGRWAFRRRRASICNAFRLLAGLWGLCLGRRPSSQCRAPAFTRQDTPRRIADDKCMEENPHQFPQRCPTLALAPMGALLSRAGHPTFNPMGSIQADVRRVRRRVQREVPSGMR